MKLQLDQCFTLAEKVDATEVLEILASACGQNLTAHADEQKVSFHLQFALSEKKLTVKRHKSSDYRLKPHHKSKLDGLLRKQLRYAKEERQRLEQELTQLGKACIQYVRKDVRRKK